MKVLVSLERRFDATPDGAIWTQTTFPYNFWKRYLEVFSGVKILARVRRVKTVSANWQRADGDRVMFVPLPFYLGPKQYLLRSYEVRRAAHTALNPYDAVIMRVGSNLASIIGPELRRRGQPYGLEVVGDPYDAFAPGAVKHPLRPIFRRLFSHRLRKLCVHAAAVAYVTECSLQRRYPASPRAYTTHYSSVELPGTAFVPESRKVKEHDRPLKFIFVGSLEQLYKAPDVLIEALSILVQNGLDVQLILLGDGKHRPELEAQVVTLGLSGRVTFLGQVSAGDAVRTQFDVADLFVLPSHTEGLPRAMIEAMARGLPCIGSNVGGIPELLSAEDMVSPGDPRALAEKIREVVTNPVRMEQMSARNLENAKKYQEDVLRMRRNAFYMYVEQITHACLGERNQGP